MEETTQEEKKVITDVVIRKVANGFMVIDVTPKTSPESKEGEVKVAYTLAEALSVVSQIM